MAINCLRFRVTRRGIKHSRIVYGAGSLLVNLAARSGRAWSGKVALRPLALSLPGGPVFLEGLALSREGLQSSGPGPRLASPRGGF